MKIEEAKKKAIEGDPEAIKEVLTYIDYLEKEVRRIRHNEESFNKYFLKEKKTNERVDRNEM